MDNITAVFQLLASARALLSEEITTLHEGGYHDLAREISDIRFGIERREGQLADHYQEISQAHAQIDSRVAKAGEES